MDKENETLETEVEETEVEETTEEGIDASEETDTEEEESDFEYDEDGNIIIPDDEENKDEAEKETTKEATEESKDDTALKERDEKIARIEKEKANILLQAKDTLKKLGVDTDDVMEGLAKLAAEADGVGLDEYKAKMKETREAEEAKRIIRQQKFEEKMAKDLAEVQAAYPETKKYSRMDQIPNFEKFGRFVDAGLTPKEAYIAANPDSVRHSVAEAVKKTNLSETKTHLKSNVPKSTNGNSIRMTHSELEEWRVLFPDKTDNEIIALYKRTKKQ